jgi:hypothetical protein
MPKSELAQTYGLAHNANYDRQDLNQNYSNFLEKISAKTSAYQLLVAEAGTTFTDRGATASVTFTLPAVTNMVAGMWFRFYGVSAYGFVVASSGSADNIVTKNDAGADTITCSTASLMIGACVKVIFDGTSWLALQESSGPTYAIA